MSPLPVTEHPVGGAPEAPGPGTMPAPAPGDGGAAPGGDQRPIDYGKSAIALAERCLDEARTHMGRKARDRQDWWNLKVYRGGSHQWDIWDPSSQRYVERGTDPAKGGVPGYVPRCVSNVYATAIDGISSILDQTEPAKQCAPARPEDADRAAANVAKDALPVLFNELGYEVDRAMIHKLITLTSMVGYAVYYDNDPKYGSQDIVLQQCEDCGDVALPASTFDAAEQQHQPGGAICPNCGSPRIGDAIDPHQGTPLGIPFPVGKMCGKVIHGFELSIPHGSRTTDTRRLPWVATHTRMDPDAIVRRWPNLKGQIQDESKGGGARGNSPTAGAYADALAGLVAPLANDGVSMQPIGPVVYEVWHDPIDTEEFYFPDGLYIVLIDQIPAESGPLQYRDDDQRPFKNILIRQFAGAPGNASGKPPADDLAPLQVQRNIVESLIDLSLMHFAAPKEWIPTTVSLIDEPTGAPGERIRYRSTVPGETPTVAQGVSPADGLYKRLELIDAMFDKLSRLNAVLAGERPPGDPTLGEVQILQERGLSAFHAPLEQLVQFETAVSTMVLQIARQTMWTSRFYKIRGENGVWDVKQFLGADLDGRVDIYIDKASAWPKSPLVHSLRLKEAVNLGAIPIPVSQDPELVGKILEDLDLSTLKPALDVDRKQISRELDRWKTATNPAEIGQPDPLVQNLKLHVALKLAYLKTEEAEALARSNPPLYLAMRQWVMAAQFLQSQAEMQMQALGVGPPTHAPQAPGQNGGAPPGARPPGAHEPARSQPAAQPTHPKQTPPPPQNVGPAPMAPA